MPHPQQRLERLVGRGLQVRDFDMMLWTALPGMARGMKKLMVSATQAVTR